jgi:hypothetical protein
LPATSTSKLTDVTQFTVGVGVDVKVGVAVKVGLGVEVRVGVAVAVKVGVGVGDVIETGITLLYPAQSPPTLLIYTKSLPSPTNAAKPLSI